MKKLRSEAPSSEPSPAMAAASPSSAVEESSAAIHGRDPWRTAQGELDLRSLTRFMMSTSGRERLCDKGDLRAIAFNAPNPAVWLDRQAQNDPMEAARWAVRLARAGRMAPSCVEPYLAGVRKYLQMVMTREDVDPASVMIWGQTLAGLPDSLVTPTPVIAASTREDLLLEEPDLFTAALQAQSELDAQKSAELADLNQNVNAGDVASLLGTVVGGMLLPTGGLPVGSISRGVNRVMERMEERREEAREEAAERVGVQTAEILEHVDDPERSKQRIESHMRSLRSSRPHAPPPEAQGWREELPVPDLHLFMATRWENALSDPLNASNDEPMKRHERTFRLKTLPVFAAEAEAAGEKDVAIEAWLAVALRAERERFWSAAHHFATRVARLGSEAGTLLAAAYLTIIAELD